MTLDGASSTTVGGLLASSAIWAIGQATPEIPPGVAVVGATAVGGTFIVWLARYLITEFVPKQSAEFKAALSEMSASHQKSMCAIVAEFRTETTEQRSQHEREIARLLSIFQEHVHRPADASNPENKR